MCLVGGCLMLLFLIINNQFNASLNYAFLLLIKNFSHIHFTTVRHLLCMRKKRKVIPTGKAVKKEIRF